MPLPLMMLQRQVVAVSLWLLVLSQGAAAQSSGGGADPFGPRPQLAEIDSVAILVSVYYPSELIRCSGFTNSEAEASLRATNTSWNSFVQELFVGRLEGNGVRVSADQNWRSDLPVLSLNLSGVVVCSGDEPTGVAWFMQIGVVQEVSLVRQPDIMAPATTWVNSASGYAAVTATDLSNLQNQALEAALEYHRAN